MTSYYKQKAAMTQNDHQRKKLIKESTKIRGQLSVIMPTAKLPTNATQ